MAPLSVKCQQDYVIKSKSHRAAVESGHDQEGSVELPLFREHPENFSMIMK